jgi:hypothetical protein
MAAGAQELAAMAGQMQELVGRFTLEAMEPEQGRGSAVVARRRGGDWQQGALTGAVGKKSVQGPASPRTRSA